MFPSLQRLALFSFSIPISYFGSLAFILCLYLGLIYLSFCCPFCPMGSLYFPFYGLFVIAAFLLMQEFSSHSSLSIISSHRSFLARIILWQLVREKTSKGQAPLWQRQYFKMVERATCACRRHCDMLCIASNSHFCGAT